MYRYRLLTALTFAFLATSVPPASALHLYQPDHEYTVQELAELNWFELALLKNEVYALHSYTFGTPWLISHFAGQLWYSPDTELSAAKNRYPELSTLEERNVEKFVEAAAELNPTFDGCWNVDDVAELEYEYFRNVSSLPAPPLNLPGEFVSLGEGKIAIWSAPGVTNQNLLPKETFAAIFERPSDFGSVFSDAEFKAAVEADAELLAENKVKDYVFRVYFRDDGTIAHVETLGLGGGDWYTSLAPYTVWRAWFNPEGAIRVFRPVYKGGGWISAEAVASFTGPPDATGMRCLIYGDVNLIDMEIRVGPYQELPFTVNLYNANRDGVERYESLAEK